MMMMTPRKSENGEELHTLSGKTSSSSSSSSSSKKKKIKVAVLVVIIIIGDIDSI